MMFSRLLVGDDGSQGAAAARVWADALASSADAEVVAACVVGASGTEPSPRPGGVGAKELVGSPAPALLAFADEVGADLVVVGRRGAGGFTELRLGSTAHQVAEHTTCPVAVVPAATAPSGDGWPFATIAVGADGSPAAAGALAWVASLAAESTAAVAVVHALEVAPAFVPSGPDEAYEQARARVERAVDEWCAPLREAGIQYSTVIEEGGAAGVLLHAAGVRDVDLLVVGRRPPGSFPGMTMGSAAHRALGFASCPTVVIPAAG